MYEPRLEQEETRSGEYTSYTPATHPQTDVHHPYALPSSHPPHPILSSLHRRSYLDIVNNPTGMDAIYQQRKIRGKLPKATTDYLKAWLYLHCDHPYPNDEEKRQLCIATGLSLSQLSNWMVNARRRILAPARRISVPEHLNMPPPPMLHDNSRFTSATIPSTVDSGADNASPALLSYQRVYQPTSDWSSCDEGTSGYVQRSHPPDGRLS